MVVVIVLANSRGGSGALVLYSFAWAVFFVPYAVLAVPIATSAFPELSARSGSFDATSATSTRAVTVASWLGAAGMAGTCIPLARVFQSHVGQAADARQLAIALAVFAPGLVGYGLMANLSRVLYAEGSKRRIRAAALAVSGGWLLVIAADLLIVPFVPRAAVVPWLGAGTTFGLIGSGIALLVLVRRFRGPEALRGWTRAALAGLAGALAGAAAGLGVSVGVRVSGFLPNVAVTLLASAAVLVAFLGVVAVADGGDLRAALRSARRGGDPPGPPATGGMPSPQTPLAGHEGRVRARHQHRRYCQARPDARGRMRGARRAGRGVRPRADRTRLRLQRSSRVRPGGDRGPAARAP